MENETRPRALIIGGSLGGLFPATTLRAIGWDVQVFERSPRELSSRGGGAVLQGPAQRIGVRISPFAFYNNATDSSPIETYS